MGLKKRWVVETEEEGRKVVIVYPENTLKATINKEFKKGTYDIYLIKFKRSS